MCLKNNFKLEMTSLWPRKCHVGPLLCLKMTLALLGVMSEHVSSLKRYASVKDKKSLLRRVRLYFQPVKLDLLTRTGFKYFLSSSIGFFTSCSIAPPPEGQILAVNNPSHTWKSLIFRSSLWITSFDLSILVTGPSTFAPLGCSKIPSISSISFPTTQSK